MTGHVKFVETPEEEKCHEGDIKIEEPTDLSVRCNVGFLQCFHKYRITLDIPATIEAPMAIAGLDVFGVALESVVQNAKQHTTTVTLVLTLGNIKGTQETIINFQKGMGQYSITIHANILGQEEGTPYLKSGVKMLEALPSTEMSEASN